MLYSDRDIEELVFLSPEEELQEDKAAEDQGASPQLRRSKRKRKSTASFGGNEMKNSGSEKKKPSPDPGKSLPRIPRIPQGDQQMQKQQRPQPQEQQQQVQQAAQPQQTPVARAGAGVDLGGLLVGMES